MHCFLIGGMKFQHEAILKSFVRIEEFKTSVIRLTSRANSILLSSLASFFLFSLILISLLNFVFRNWTKYLLLKVLSGNFCPRSILIIAITLWQLLCWLQNFHPLLKDCHRSFLHINKMILEQTRLSLRRSLIGRSSKMLGLVTKRVQMKVLIHKIHSFTRVHSPTSPRCYSHYFFFFFVIFRALLTLQKWILLFFFSKASRNYWVFHLPSFEDTLRQNRVGHYEIYTSQLKDFHCEVSRQRYQWVFSFSLLTELISLANFAKLSVTDPISC